MTRTNQVRSSSDARELPVDAVDPMADRSAEYQATAAELSAAAAALSAKPLKLRAEINISSAIDDDYYMDKCDKYVWNALGEIPNPTIADFERLFNHLEETMHAPEMHPLYPMLLDDTAPRSTRMLMALMRYSE